MVPEQSERIDRIEIGRLMCERRAMLAEVAALKAERDDLRDAIRLMIERSSGRKWKKVSDEAVDFWVNEIRALKRNGDGVSDCVLTES